MQGDNYRKAKRGETKCMDCRHIFRPGCKGVRHKCTYGTQDRSLFRVIGQRSTCDKAERPEGTLEET